MGVFLNTFIINWIETKMSFGKNLETVDAGSSAAPGKTFGAHP